MHKQTCIDTCSFNLRVSLSAVSAVSSALFASSLHTGHTVSIKTSEHYTRLQTLARGLPRFSSYSCRDLANLCHCCLSMSLLQRTGFPTRLGLAPVYRHPMAHIGSCRHSSRHTLPRSSPVVCHHLLVCNPISPLHLCGHC